MATRALNGFASKRWSLPQRPRLLRALDLSIKYLERRILENPRSLSCRTVLARGSGTQLDLLGISDFASDSCFIDCLIAHAGRQSVRINVLYQVALLEYACTFCDAVKHGASAVPVRRFSIDDASGRGEVLLILRVSATAWPPTSSRSPPQLADPGNPPTHSRAVRRFGR